VDCLLGDSSKARRMLGWKPEITFDSLVEMMVLHDLERARQEALLVGAGRKITNRVLNG
jgi:GDPmannose 4,6-dehydratase